MLKFDRIYLVTSYHTKNRLKETLPHLKENGIEPELFVAPLKGYFPQFHRFNTEDVWPGKLSLACAYEQLFQKCILENVNLALFIEDDVVMLEGWENVVEKEWQLDGSWNVAKADNQTHFFAMKLAAMKQYLNKFALNFNSIDFQINMLTSVKISNGVAKQKSLRKQVPSAIDVEGEKVEYIF